ncbi:hypothetical protein TNCV_308641 [Trichonephila clavipes]|nr:hypothetical protein TNCV_308641 [Trichonephila clavipes]
MQGNAILRVRMAERSKALRSGRSPILWAWVPNTKCKETLSHVRKADRCKALRLDHIPLLWAWVKNYMQGKAILRVREAEQSTALRSGRSPLLWAWVPKTKCKGKLFHMSGCPDRSKALCFDYVPPCGRGSNPTSDSNIIQSSFFFSSHNLNVRKRSCTCQDGRVV